MIASAVPSVAAGNTLPLIYPDEAGSRQYDSWAPLLLANFNSLMFDYIVRQKAQSTHLNWYIVEQLPMIRPEQFEGKIGKHHIGDFVRGEVLRLSYTAWDLQPFARDLGYDGAPFVWDEEDRRHRIARLDALFFHLYGINRDNAAYILGTFPIVREQDEKGVWVLSHQRPRPCLSECGPVRRSRNSRVDLIGTRYVRTGDQPLPPKRSGRFASAHQPDSA